MAMVPTCLSHRTTPIPIPAEFYIVLFKSYELLKPTLQDYNTFKRNVIRFVVQTVDNLELTKHIRDFTVLMLPILSSNSYISYRTLVSLSQGFRVSGCMVGYVWM
jgi:hypothetical protein